MEKLRMLSLCSGIGGADLAAEWTKGIEVVGQVEINPFCQQVLALHWPHVKRLVDIKEVVGNEFGPIDLVVGGIPCQPFSSAGQRRGTADDRHLWPYAFAILKQARPRWVLIENVRGFVRLALDLVLADLEGAGYEARAVVLPACAVGAPHIRERCFILAYSGCDRQWIWEDQSQCKPGSSEQAHACLHGTQSDLANTHGERGRTWGSQSEGQSWTLDADLDGAPKLADAQHGGRKWWSQHQEPSSPVVLSRCAPTGPEPQSRLGGSFDGFSAWLDRYCWPASPGELQYSWEPSRVVQERAPNRRKRLEELGNAIVPHQIYPFFLAIVLWEQAMRGERV